MLACDGLFDVLTSQQAVDYARRQLAKDAPLERAAQALVRHAIDDKDSRDNVSVVLVRLAPRAPGFEAESDSDDAEDLLADLGLGPAPPAGRPVARDPFPLANRTNAFSRPAAEPPKASSRIIDDDDLMDFLMDDSNFD